MRVRRLPSDGYHSVSDRMPEPDVQLDIQCDNDDIGGAAALGEDGKWYWTWNGELDQEVTFEVTRWMYL